jgi:DNA-binding NarL/FixJ family response regulator
VKFFVLNDQPERREGLKALLRQIDRRAKISGARDWRQTACALKREPYDLFIVDWQLRWMNAADLRQLLREHPLLPVAILIDNAMRQTVDLLLGAGALGIVPRNLDPRLILRIFELVLLGGRYIPACALDPELPNAMRTLARRAQLASELKSHTCTGAGSLSPRQHQIMRLVHMGSTNKLIARALGISEGTVKIHLATIFKLLGAANRAAAVAIYNGWQFNKLEVLTNESKTFALQSERGKTSIPLKPCKPPQLPAPLSYPLLMAAQPPAYYHPDKDAMLQKKLPDKEK